MSYKQAMEEAGAEVHVFSEFGSYSGDWWARVTFKGEEGWAHGAFGSCSGCDSFEAEFGYGVGEHDHGDRWGQEGVNLNHSLFDPTTCEKCALIHDDLIAFGERYVKDALMTQDEAENIVKKDLEWDLEVPEVLIFLQENAVGSGS